MKIVTQRVTHAEVVIANETHSKIGQGLFLLVGIEHDDTLEDAQWLAAKIVNMRIFDDADGVMNLSVKDVNGEILVVSQFTLHASTKKGNRPSYIQAARPEMAEPLYEEFKTVLTEQLGKAIQSGQFGADMQCTLTNSGPVTIIIDSKNKI